MTRSTLRRRLAVQRLFRTYVASADLNAALLDQETGFRGYALTRDPDYLAPYRAGRRTAAAVEPRLRRAERDYPALRGGRVRVKEAADRWQAEVAGPGIRQRASRWTGPSWIVARPSSTRSGRRWPTTVR